MVNPVANSRVTPLGPESSTFVLSGVVTSSFDGRSFDAVSQWDDRSPAAAQPWGFLDLAAGGLRVLEAHPERHEYRVAAAAQPGQACLTAEVASPCLVPRLATLAHERLRTAREYSATLAGRIEWREAAAGDGWELGAAHPGIARAATLASGALVAATLAALAVVLVRARAKTLLGRVRVAARQAIRATGRDPALQGLRVQLLAMVRRAVDLESARSSCARGLKRIDAAAALQRKRDAYAQSDSPQAREAGVWVAAECAEAERLQRDLAASIVGLERIESALRVVTLRLRKDGAPSGEAPQADPVAAAAAELGYRDAAKAEIERLLRAHGDTSSR